MAVITAAAFRAAVRYGDSPEEIAECDRVYAFALEAVEAHAPGATDAAKSEAVVRLGGYVLDMPRAARGDGYARAGVNSGAWAILSRWHMRRAGVIGGNGA